MNSWSASFLFDLSGYSITNWCTVLGYINSLNRKSGFTWFTLFRVNIDLFI